MRRDFNDQTMSFKFSRFEQVTEANSKAFVDMSRRSLSIRNETEPASANLYLSSH